MYYIYTNDKTDFNNSYHRILPKFYTAQNPLYILVPANENSKE